MNAKEIIKNEFKKSGLISFFYRKYTPSNGVTYNTNHKNWHIAEGAGYGSSIRLNYGLDMLKDTLIVLCDMEIKYYRLEKIGITERTTNE